MNIDVYKLRLLVTELHIVEQKIHDILNSNSVMAINYNKNKKLNFATKNAFIYISRVNQILQSKYGVVETDWLNKRANQLEQFGYLTLSATEEEIDSVIEYFINKLELRESNSKQSTSSDT